MIVRETKDAFLMITQDDHGQAAERIMQHWKKELFADANMQHNVLNAIKLHDVGWVPFDEQPFWNDAKQTPYNFTDFPLPSKIVLYRRGIDEVEQEDAYAAMLCSRHYEHFLTSDSSEVAQQFILEEQQRRMRLAALFTEFDVDLFKKQYGLLQLGDNFSLYCCINEPGVSKEDEHSFFKTGIPVPQNLDGFSVEKLDIQFKNETDIKVEPFPFEEPFDLVIPQREVLKKTIATEGLVSAYTNTTSQDFVVRFDRV